MPAADILKFATSSPADTTPLTRLKQAGYGAESILGVVGKSEGNGCVNDFSRTLSSCVWDPLIPSSSISIFSGGTEGVLSPHVTFVVSSSQPTGLVASVSRTRELSAHEIGTAVQSDCVASTVKSMLETEGVSPADVHLVLIKCPLLTSDKITAIRASGRQPVTTDTYESMAKSRYASAMGVSVALGELPSTTSLEETLSNPAHWTAKASCSSGAELEDCHILILANAPQSTVLPSTTTTTSDPETPIISAAEGFSEPILSSRPTLQAFSTVMTSAIDFPSISSILSTALSPPPGFRTAVLVQLFAKAEADPSGKIRGRVAADHNADDGNPTQEAVKFFRHTMNTDSDLHSTRHARAAVGGLIAGVTGDCEVYVSGGAEGQGPAGGGGVCVVVRYE